MVPHLCTALLAVLSLHLDATVAECECGKNNLDKRIIGGTESQVHEWPWQVALMYYYNETETFSDVFVCGGSLIAPRWVLTAAHCVDKAKKRNMSVIIGDHNLHTGSDTSHTQRLKVRKIKVHKDYYMGHNEIRHDIAVIKLSRPVEYSQWISPVCLPTNLRTRMFDGEHATVAGWGRTSSYHDNGSNVLLDVTLQIISNFWCKFKLMFSHHLFSGAIQLCTYDGGRNFCEGDSGGALVWLDNGGYYQQIGIVSAVDKRCTVPGVYTRVTNYLDWIEKKTKTRFCAP